MLTGEGLVPLPDDRHLNVLSDRPPEQRAHVGHDELEIEDFGLQQLLVARGRELSDQRCCLFGRFLDGLDLPPDRIGLRDICQDRVGMEHYDHQKVGKFVSNPAPQLSHGLYLLPLTQVLFVLAQRLTPPGGARQTGRSGRQCRSAS